ncbi:MAG TPA: hypothetical protein VF920_12220 [Dongiaceae bacterium]
MVERNKGTIKRSWQLPLKADLALSIGNREVEQFNPVCSTIHSTAGAPAPVIRLFMDQMTQAAVLAAADDPDPTRMKGQICEANFYSGELSLTKELKDEATRLLRLAANDCPHGFNERDAANAELKALGVVP